MVEVCNWWSGSESQESVITNSTGNRPEETERFNLTTVEPDFIHHWIINRCYLKESSDDEQVQEGYRTGKKINV